MFLKSIQKTKFGSTATVIVVILALWLSALLGKAPRYSFIFDSFPMPFYQLIATYLNPFPAWSLVVIISLFIISVIYLLKLNARYIILKNRTSLPILFFALCSIAFLPIQRLNPALVSLLFVLLAVNHLFAIYQKHDSLDNLFRAGISIGIATLIYAPAVAVVIWALLTLLVLRTFNVREWFVLIFAFTVPWLLYMLILFIVNDDILKPYHFFMTSLLTESESAIDEKVFWIYSGFLVIPFAVSLFGVFPKLAYQKNIIRRYYNTFLYLFIIGFLSFLLIPGASYEIFYITAIPSAFIMSSYFNDAKPNFWNELLLWMPIVGAILVQVVLLIK